LRVLISLVLQLFALLLASGRKLFDFRQILQCQFGRLLFNLISQSGYLSVQLFVRVFELFHAIMVILTWILEKIAMLAKRIFGCIKQAFIYVVLIVLPFDDLVAAMLVEWTHHFKLE